MVSVVSKAFRSWRNQTKSALWFNFTQLVDKTLKDPTTYKPLKKDPTAKLERQLKKTLKTLHTNREISDSIFSHLNPNNSQPPYARATVKIHKNPVKTRILVCSRGAVYYNTAQHLSRILAPLGKTGSSFVKDSASLVQKLRNTSDTKKLVSYDVVDLFTNIPIKEAIHILSTRLQIYLPDLDTKLTAQVSKCFETSYFNWNGQLFQQIHRLPLGSPLSPLLTEIYMIAFEETALKTAPFTPKHWFRKVDDVLALLDDNQDPEALLQHLNSQHPRIQFTMEEETHQQLPFLDILLHRHQQSIATSVYRKPTHTDQYIHHQSNHHPQIKKGIVATLARRAKAVCSSDSLHSELKHLKSTFQDLNEYPPHLVSNTITKTLKETP
ncbi:uncharacterized protein, partial [Haliotis asinina]|uniref:uncharacterized protein n=1 Tax=Haliotis asinina TaxID=109174 RepID=UPI0035320A65